MEKNPDYVVKAKTGQKVTWGIMTILMLVLCALPVALALHELDMLKDTWGIYAFILAVFFFLAVCSAVQFFSLARPVAEVYGDKIVYSTKKGRKAEICIDDITARISAPVAQGNPAAMGGLMGYLICGGRPTVVMNYRYRSHGKDIFTINSSMVNADRLDMEIYSSIRKKEEAPGTTGE